MKIQRLTQFDTKRAGRSLEHGYSVTYLEREEARFFDIVKQETRTANGWSKHGWLGLCNTFRLEFIYG